MSISHTWNVFRRVRVGFFGLISLLDLALALIVLVALVGGWASYNSSQKMMSSVVFFINLFSTLCLILLFLMRIRPIADLACIFLLMLFQIGSVVTFALSAPSLPCSTTGATCQVQQSAILYGSCASCTFLCLYLLFLFPILRMPQSRIAPAPVKATDKSLMTFSDTASSLTYCSWDRNPGKDSKHASMDTYYSQASPGGYSFSLHGKSPRSLNQPTLPAKIDLPFPQNTHRPRNPPSSNSSPLRPYSPPPCSPPVVKSPGRASVCSNASQDTTAYAASWLMEPPRALLSPTPSTKRSPFPKSGASPPYISRGLGNSVAVANRTSTDHNRGKVLSTHQKKRRPQMLSIDTSDSVTLSDVPRSPSPIEAYSPRSPFPPTPRSGILPKHPRLTMHMRDLARGQTPSPGFIVAKI